MTAETGDPQRRLATIMAADIAGYSTITDADEETTYVNLRTVRADIVEPRIVEFGERIVKHLGDGLLAELPVVMSAVQCARKVQEEMANRNKDLPREKEIRFPIAINLVDIIVDEEGVIFGEGVNVAAHLEPLAIPGCICVPEAVYAAVQKKLEVRFDDLGDQSRGKTSEPVHAFDLRWPGEGGTSEERSLKPAGRPKPVGLLAGVVSALLVVVVIGLVLWRMAPFQRLPEQALDHSIAVLPFVNMSSDPEQDHSSDGIFTVQDEIAAGVVDALKLTLLGDAPEVEQTNPQAYALFLQARYLNAQGTADSFEQAIHFYNQVLELAPDYARAWRGLAATYTNQANRGLRTRSESSVLAREAIDRIFGRGLLPKPHEDASVGTST